MIDRGYLRANLRKGLYAFIAAVVPILVYVGATTGTQALAVGALASAVVTLVFALYHAHRLGAPIERQVIYGVASALAAVGVAFGIWSPGLVEVTLPAVASFFALFLADVTTNEDRSVAAEDAPSPAPRRAVQE